ncbi:triphosphoribosyl-dephospho-CoA synthase CitG [Enterococcus phoeniculicola]|uniref:Probable 2-(5''-triphosphoribosyl)-3'-dephosphocoenzyme-A synthase n=1 Tax=Enterococcus phoeniculicola ATCC BAA-412 TaxID=1158610 RepID=R3TKI2_9ENTE|nr:triphosphoribosyl-dephospho-CoA synthase CitG [Enterococcus phoeniculicola]EOL41924.1 triphosphoribosyl-dephospho-CoA synthase CitG [Enterococcus phoeniculicola ATCC BAA-412]EOT79797.1 triphosphoribosyl-dephospho-CoA synthase CitG [Enterococcus phoeniculicola ATCC BAA-412]
MINSSCCHLLTDYAEKALLYEVTLSPKPGLVDPLSAGAHNDMDVFTFINSTVSLRPFFHQYVEAGLTHTGTPIDLFDKLRNIGVQAEKAMLQATDGVNTHKGANFSFAVILGATGWHLQKRTLSTPWTKEDSQQVFERTSQLTEHLILKDFANLETKQTLSYGEKLYLDYGVAGIRGEAAAGYPSLSHKLLPFLRNLQNLPVQERLLRALLFLMSEIEDGNLLHRGGFNAWEEVKLESKKIHQAALTKEELLDELQRYDLILTKRHLSPGGSADLLALGIYFAQLEGIL